MRLHVYYTVLSILLASMLPARALVHRSYDSNKHDPFIGFPNPTARNPNFIFSHLDFTGVGWKTSDTRLLYTMVSPIHFVGASHVAPSAGQTIRFFAPDNTIQSFVVDSQTIITQSEQTDLLIGKLTQAIPTNYNIRHHPYLNLTNDNAYLNEPLVILGTRGKGGSQTSAAFANVSVDDRTTKTISSSYLTLGFDSDEVHFETGDSGGPTMIEHDGVAAIIGTNSAFATAPFLGTIVNYSNFIPFYINELNAVMETDGYRMTKAIPGSTTLKLNHQIQSETIRAGHPFDINLTINNTTNTLAENLRLTNTFSLTSNVSNAIGADWFDQSIANTTIARRAKLERGISSNYVLTLTIPAAGVAQHGVTFSCDQFPAITQNFDITVISSFLSFVSELADATPTGDSDLDGLGNLLEYAFGGDPSTPSHLLPETSIPLLPELKMVNGIIQLSYLRHKDFVERAISYDLKSTITMAPGTWANASSLITKTTVNSINTEFEQVTYELSNTSNHQFFRIEITLNE